MSDTSNRTLLSAAAFVLAALLWLATLPVKVGAGMGADVTMLSII